MQHKIIVYEQFSQFRYIATIEFESRKNKTFIKWIILFESKEYLIQSAKAFKVAVGLQQNAEKLIKYLQKIISQNLKNENG